MNHRNSLTLATSLATLALRSGPAIAHAAPTPTISIVAVDSEIAEGGAPGAFIVTREGGKIETPLTVSFSLSGTATPGSDYVSPGTAITLLPYSSMQTIKIAALRDALVEGSETVTVTLTPKSGVYELQQQRAATLIIKDATSNADKGGSTQPHSPPIVDPAKIPSNHLPKADRSGSLFVSITFDGTGYWKQPRTGAYANLKFHRELSYTVPLRGTYSPGSGMSVIEKREQHGMGIADFKRYLIGQPANLLAGAGTPCGSGSVSVLDESSGMEVGDPGQPQLVPFKQQIKGGGAYPSGDKTVPERDLCLTAVAFDNQKHLLHLQIDGSDTHVKVTNSHNGHVAPAYNLRLQGDAADAKSKFTLLDLPIAAGALSNEGAKSIPNVSMASGPDHSVFPLSATVKWRVAMQ